jgi:hypothetical protein
MGGQQETVAYVSTCGRRVIVGLIVKIRVGSGADQVAAIAHRLLVCVKRSLIRRCFSSQ